MLRITATIASGERKVVYRQDNVITVPTFTVQLHRPRRDRSLSPSSMPPSSSSRRRLEDSNYRTRKQVAAQSYFQKDADAAPSYFNAVAVPCRGISLGKPCTNANEVSSSSSAISILRQRGRKCGLMVHLSVPKWLARSKVLVMLLQQCAASFIPTYFITRHLRNRTQANVDIAFGEELDALRVIRVFSRLDIGRFVNIEAMHHIRDQEYAMEFEKVHIKRIAEDSKKDTECIAKLQSLWDKHANGPCPLGYACELGVVQFQTTMVPCGHKCCVKCAAEVCIADNGRAECPM